MLPSLYFCLLRTYILGTLTLTHPALGEGGGGGHPVAHTSGDGWSIHLLGVGHLSPDAASGWVLGLGGLPVDVYKDLPVIHPVRR